MESSSKPSAHNDKPTAMDGVWQWLCYSLWELALISVAAALGTSLSYFFIIKIDNYGFAIALLGAMITLVPLAIVMDFFYRRRETIAKRGFPAVVMGIHSVGAFILSLFALIWIVTFALVRWVDSAALDNPKAIGLLGAILVLLFNVALFVRITDTKLAPLTRRIFPGATATLSVLALALLLLGPIKHLSEVKSDIKIDRGLPTVDTAVMDYETSHSKLPPNLAVLTTDSASFSDLNDEGKYLISHDLISYKANTSAPTKADPTSSQTFYYQLCATYHGTSGTPAGGTMGETALNSGDHPTGFTCYHLNSDGT